jgi:IS30 family transposase
MPADRVYDVPMSCVRSTVTSSKAKGQLPDVPSSIYRRVSRDHTREEMYVVEEVRLEASVSLRQDRVESPTFDLSSTPSLRNIIILHLHQQLSSNKHSSWSCLHGLVTGAWALAQYSTRYLREALHSKMLNPPSTLGRQQTRPSSAGRDPLIKCNSEEENLKP